VAAGEEEEVVRLVGMSRFSIPSELDGVDQGGCWHKAGGSPAALAPVISRGCGRPIRAGRRKARDAFWQCFGKRCRQNVLPARASSRAISDKEAAATGTVHQLGTGGVPVTLGMAAAACLATLGRPEQASTLRAYGKLLRRVVGEFGEDTPVGDT
jgi:hypothetical protein